MTLGQTLIFCDPPRQTSTPLSMVYALLASKARGWAVVGKCPTPNAARNAKRRLVAALVECELEDDVEVVAAGCEVFAMAY